MIIGEMLMTLQELQKQALQLPVCDRQFLAESLLSSIQQEAYSFNIPVAIANAFAHLDPWTQSLIGIVRVHTEDPMDAYVDYLEEKYS